jgi:hypothetical protein
MNREERREQLRDWRRLTPAERAHIALAHPEVVPESVQWQWERTDQDGFTHRIVNGRWQEGPAFFPGPPDSGSPEPV